jgi:hypothetical protein
MEVKQFEMKSDKKMAIALIAILILSAFILVIPVSADGADSGVSSGHRWNLVRSPSTFQAFDRSPPQSHDSRMKDSPEDGALIQGSIVQGEKVGAIPGYVSDLFLLPWAAYAVPDVTGDNTADVLVNTIQYSEDGDLTKQRVIAKMGTNGSHLWEEEAPGETVNMDAHGVLDWDWNWYWHWYWYGYPESTEWYHYWTMYRGEDPYLTLDESGKNTLWYENRDWPWAWDWDWYWYWNWDGGDYGDWYIYSKHTPGMADMNCDGKGDVLVLLNEYDDEMEYTTKATVIAKNGTTGAHLWEENVTGDDVRMWAYGVPDMSCDGKTDVLVKTGELDETNETGTYRIIAKNGTNGDHLWEEPFSFTFVEDGWFDVWADGVPDMSCDGKTDVLVKTYEFVLKYTGVKDWWYLNNATIIANNGTDGSELWNESFTRNVDEESYDELWVDAYAFPDMNCDNKTDVLVTVYEYNDTTYETNVTLIAKNGTDGSELWNVSFETGGDYDLGVYPYGVPDMSGDGKTDVLVNILEFEWDDWELGDVNRTINMMIRALNGTDGSELWNESIPLDGANWLDVWAYGVPDLNGDGKTDVLVKSHAYDDEWDLINVTLIAKNGTNGDHLWEEPISLPEDGMTFWLDVWAHGVPDMSGDDKTDVLVKIQGYDDWYGNFTSVTIIAKNGTDGTHLWQENITGDEYTGIWDDVYAVPDMNGDDKTDVFVMVYEYNWSTNDTTVRIIVKNGTNGDHLWEENFTSDEEEELWVRGGVAPDLDGDGKPDVLVSTLELNTTTGGVTNTVIAKKGTNGTHLWEESLSSVIAATGGGATFEPDAGTFCEPLTAIAIGELPPGATPLPPAEFPYGFFGFTICGLENGATVNITITLPGPAPVGMQYWKYGPNGSTNNPQPERWYQIPIGDDDGDNVITITVQDGGGGDDDGVANGVIVDQGAPGTPRAAAERLPALTPLGIAALVGLLSIIATSTLLKKKKR